MMRGHLPTQDSVASLFGKLWFGLLVGAIVGIGAGTYWSTTRDTEYEATTVYYLRPPQTTDATQALTADIYAFNRAKLYVSLMSSIQLADRVAKRIKSDPSAAHLASTVTASDIYQTALITTTVTAKSGDEALLVARAYAAELPGYAKGVEKDSGLQNAGNLITAVDGPRLTSGGTRGVMFNVAGGAAVFALLGLAGSYWYRRKYLVSNATSVSLATGISVYARVDLRDEPALDRMLARLMSERHQDGHLTIASPYARDGAESFGHALVNCGERLDVAVRLNESEVRPGLAISCRAVLEETPGNRVPSHGPELIAVRQGVTSKRSLIAAARILTAIDPSPILGVVILKHAGRRYGSADSRQGPIAEPAETGTHMAPVRA